MVTITLEKSTGFSKTHFKDWEELLNYMMSHFPTQYENESVLLNELNRRLDTYNENPKIVVKAEETIDKLRCKWAK
jgi:threonine synthase